MGVPSSVSRADAPAPDFLSEAVLSLLGYLDSEKSPGIGRLLFDSDQDRASFKGLALQPKQRVPTQQKTSHKSRTFGVDLQDFEVHIETTPFVYTLHTTHLVLQYAECTATAGNRTSRHSTTRR